MSEWTREKPRTSGVYAITGWDLSFPASIAVIEVRKHAGDFVCNLHRETSSRRIREWPYVGDMSDRFLWKRLCALPKYNDTGA